MKKLLLVTVLIFLSVNIYAQKGQEVQKYRRSSLASALIKHSAYKYADEIEQAFLQIPTPDKFNNHDLPVRTFESSASKMRKAGEEKFHTNMQDIEAFLAANSAARNMVAKWFRRDSITGAFDMSLIQERGYYNASQEDIALATGTYRSLATLGDKGEDLIGNTFMVVHDITFVDKGEQSAKAATFFKLLGAIAGAATNNKELTRLGDTTGRLINEIDGFNVNIASYLYRLDWNKDLADRFYTEFWYDRENVDSLKKVNFNQADSLFRLNYIGSSTSSAGNVFSKHGSKLTKEQQMLKVCTRAIDNAIVELQRTYDEFKVNVPIWHLNEDGTVEVQIGLKEGLNEKSKYDVLQAVEDKNGKVTYNKIGSIRPVKGKIWDNRFGALEDAEAAQSSGHKADTKDGDAFLKASTFKIVSGGNKVLPGCLVREATIKHIE